MLAKTKMVSNGGLLKQHFSVKLDLWVARGPMDYCSKPKKGRPLLDRVSSGLPLWTLELLQVSRACCT